MDYNISPDLKIHHILTLSPLLTMGAKHNFISITTSSLGSHINKSQQTASQHLTELEQHRFIKRIINGHSASVIVTTKGYNEIKKLFIILKSNMNSFLSYVELRGTLVSGMGEGAYYMSLPGYKKQFKSKIGYIPFPGTLNIKLHMKTYIESLSQFTKITGILIDGFSDNKRTYGWVKCFHAILNKSIHCDLIFLERTHHDESIIEIISKDNLRRTISISDGSTLTLKIPLSS